MDYEMTSPSSTPEMQNSPRPEYKKRMTRRCSGNKVKDTNMVDDDSNDTVEVGDETKCNGIRGSKNLACAKDRWGKLKTTMTVANSITPKKKSTRLDRGDSFLRKFSTRNQAEVKEDTKGGDADFKATRTRKKWLRNYVIHPYGGLMFYWLGVVTIAVMYNLWTCIAREAFREIQHGYTALWFCLDGVSDFIYICDIFVHLRTGFLQQGLMVYDSTKLCKNYVKDRCFVVDLLCLLPLDLLQLYIGIHPMLRFPRFLKMYRCIMFMHTYESRTAYPNLLRVANLTHILFLGSHWFAAFYYLISEAEGFDGEWSYPKPENKYASVTRKYLASLYWSTLTLTTIGDLPPPDTNWQYVFVIVSYLIGVFIFATIVGQVGNVITNRNASRQEFERLLDGAKFYMQMHNIPPDLQRRVQRWYDYVWARGRLNCNDINSLGLLPDKLKTELALHVNLGTLKKVTIFQKCRPEFLHDLMLKMRAYIFTPGDMICRRGEVAREMFIIADGVVEILGENATVLTQMSTGDFFGEIGILNLDGGINRRTADVRSVGYSELFVLSREDVLAALKDHPDAEQIIREFGQRRLKETEEHRKMVKSAPNSPDPSSAWKRDSRNGKGSKREPNRLVIPTVKYLQKLPQMSPKLKKMFRRKPTRAGTSDKQNCMNDDKHDDVMTDSAVSADTSDEEYDLKNAVRNKETEHQSRLPLEIIEEKDGGVENSGETDAEDNIGAKNFTIASVVLNLLKNKRKSEYTSVKTGEGGTDDEFGKIKIGNIVDLVSGPSASVTGAENDGKTNTLHEKGTCPKEFQEDVKSAQSIEQESTSVILDNGTDSDSCREIYSPVLLTPPKIVLTRDTNLCNSDSSDSGEEFPNHPPTPHPARRSHLTRKSSPCILPTPSPFSDKFRRRVSLPPPLDLPIEVPRFSQFRGLTPNSDVTALLQQFKRSLDSRLDDIETSYKETLEKVERNIGTQEKMMRCILQILSDKTVTISADGGLDEDEEEFTKETADIPDSRPNYEEQLRHEFQTVPSETSDGVYCEQLRYKAIENMSEPETVKPETNIPVAEHDGDAETTITIEDYCNVGTENQNTEHGNANTRL